MACNPAIVLLIREICDLIASSRTFAAISRNASKLAAGYYGKYRLIGFINDGRLERNRRCAPDVPERYTARGQEPCFGREIKTLNTPRAVLLRNDTGIPPMHIPWANQDSVCPDLFSCCNSPHYLHLRNEYSLLNAVLLDFLYQ